MDQSLDTNAVTLTKTLCGHLAESAYSDLGHKAAGEARRGVLDWLGCALVGSRHPTAGGRRHAAAFAACFTVSAGAWATSTTTWRRSRATKDPNIRAYAARTDPGPERHPDPARHPGEWLNPSPRPA